MNDTTRNRRIVFYVLMIVVMLIVMFQVFRSNASLPTGLRQQAAPVCEKLGTHIDGRAIWIGECVAAGVSITKPAVTDTPSETTTPIPSTATDAPATATIATGTGTTAPTGTNTPLGTPTATVGASVTSGPSATPLPTITQAPTPIPGVAIAPYIGAPLCVDNADLHLNERFHTLWDSALGCHYDHEHGRNPFTPEVAAIFPGFDLLALGCGRQIGHCNPSSPIENAAVGGKHGGNKWDVALASYLQCAGYESAPIGVNAAVIQYHAFGNYAIELNGRIHSAMALIRQCKASNPTDYGYAYIVQHVDYGQRTVPYQGDIMPYPDNPPAYDPPRGPYVSFDCFGVKDPSTPPERGVCRPSLAFVLTRNANANSIWTSKPTGAGGDAVQGSKLLNILFRIRDTFQLLDWNDQSYPFTFRWLCSNDGGLTYAPVVGCRYNNTTSHVHEMEGTIPAEWDNQVWDLDRRPGRITGAAFVTRFGDLVPEGACFIPGITCFPIKLVNAFVGKYSSELIDGKITQFSAEGQPERDICFTTAGVLINCDLPGARSAGWIGPEN